MKKIKKIFLLLVFILIFTACSTTSSNKNEKMENTEYSPSKYIIGIEPGSGTAQISAEVIKKYGLNQKMTSGSSAVMTQLLGDAYKNKEDIVVTGWTPHWIFGKYDLKYLEDPKNGFGEPEQIVTLTRQGFAQYSPGANQILDKFHWTAEDMQSVLMDINEGRDVRQAAKDWVDKNRNLVDEWIKDSPNGDGQTIRLAYTIWDSEYASAYVIMTVLEEKNYNVSMMAVEPGPLFAALAYGSADASVSAWLPKTHKNYMDKYGDTIVNLGANMEDASIGFVVPQYMEIDSIEDLKNYK